MDTTAAELLRQKQGVPQRLLRCHIQFSAIHNSLLCEGGSEDLWDFLKEPPLEGDISFSFCIRRHVPLLVSYLFAGIIHRKLCVFCYA